MTGHLLDANVVIASVDEEHVFHDCVERWLSTTPGPRAVCPIAEGALVRHLVRRGYPAIEATSAVDSYLDTPGLEFWPADLSYRDVDLSRVYGHRQVTDAYLVALAVAHGGLLATLDEALARAYPDGAVLIPA